MLFVDSQGLGDVVQSLPLLRAVCHWADGRWPVRVLFATEDHYELVREEKLKVISFFVSSVPRKPHSLLRLWSNLAGQSDLIVCAPEMSAAKLILLKYAIGARYAVGEASAIYRRFLTFSKKASWIAPWTETQDAIASALGIKTPLPPPSISVSKNEVAWTESALLRAGIGPAQPILGLQCSSVVPQKCWPAENYVKVVNAVYERYPGLCIVSFGNSVERPTADAVHKMAKPILWLEGAGNWGIRQSLAMLRRCDLFVSGDTGLMHMAAAVGTRTVSIFGPTSAIRRAPVHNGGLAVCPQTPCHPCFRGAWTPCDCIRSIGADRVIWAAIQLLSKAGAVKDDRNRIYFEVAENVEF